MVLKHAPRAVLDAKYRDLWETNLPREMLYQLAVYGMSAESAGTASILYPTIAAGAREQRIELRDPVTSARRGEIVLRPVNLLRLHDLLQQGRKESAQRALRAEAHRLVFGS